MSRTQRVVAVGVSVLTVAALASLVAGAPALLVRLLDVACSLSLFAVALAVPKPYRQQVLITVALGLSALGDLILSRIVPLPVEGANAAGMACFLAAYIVLTVALLHGRPQPWEAFLVVPFLGTGTAVVWALSPYLTGVFLLAVPIFLLVITVMAWSAATTFTRSFFVSRVRNWATVGAALLFFSDALVAFEMFYPPFVDHPPVLVHALMRASCIAGWLLMLLVVCDPVLRELPDAARVGSGAE